MMGILRAFGALFLNSKGGAVRARNGKGVEPPAEPQVRGTVLAIDDDPSMLEVLRPLLSAEGFNVLTAKSGAKGLDMLRYCQRDVRLVVLDYHMPHFDGAATLD